MRKSIDELIRLSNLEIEKKKANDMLVSPNENSSKIFEELNTSLKQKRSTLTPDQGYMEGGFGQSKYDKYITSEELNNGESLNDFRANQQGGWAELGGGIAHTLTTAVGETLKLPGLIVGGAEALQSGDPTKIIDDSWTKLVQSGMDYVNNDVTPVYQNSKLKDGSLMDNLSSGEFWANEGANGVGFLASMMVPGELLKLANIEGKATKLFSKVAKPGTAAAMGDFTSNLAAGGLNAAIEAASEARETFDKVLKDTNNRAKAGEAAAGVFSTNMALLMGPNLIDQYLIGKVFPKAKLNTSIASNLFKDGDLIEKVPLALKDKAIKATSRIGAGIAKEGAFEEGLQFATSEYYQNKALGKEDKGVIDGIFNTYLNSLDNLDFQKSIALGSILGAGMSSIGGAIGDIKETTQYKKIHDIYKNNLVSDYSTLNDIAEKDEQGNIVMENGKPKVDPLKFTHFVNDKMNQKVNVEMQQYFVDNNNKEGYDFIHEFDVFNYMKPFFDVEKGTVLLDNAIDNIAKKEEEYYKSVGLEATNSQEVKSKLRKQAEYFNNIYQNVKLQNENDLKNVKLEGTQDEIDYKKSLLFNSKLTEAIKYNYFNDRINNLSSEISREGVNINDESTIDNAISELYAQKKANKISPDKIDGLKAKIYQLFQYQKERDKTVETFEDLRKQETTKTVDKEITKAKEEINENLKKAEQETSLQSIQGNKYKNPMNGIIYTVEGNFVKGSDGSTLSINSVNDLEGLEKLDEKDLPADSNLLNETVNNTVNNGINNGTLNPDILPNDIKDKVVPTGNVVVEETIVEKPQPVITNDTTNSNTRSVDELISLLNKSTSNYIKFTLEEVALLDSNAEYANTKLTKMQIFVPQQVFDDTVYHNEEDPIIVDKTPETEVTNTNVKEVINDKLAEKEKESIDENPNQLDVTLLNEEEYNEVVTQFHSSRRNIDTLFNGLSVKSHETIEGINGKEEIPSRYASAQRLALFTRNNDVSQFVIKISDSFTPDNYEELAKNVEANKDKGELYEPLHTIVGKYVNGKFTPVDEEGKTINDYEIRDKGIYTYMTNPSLTYDSLNSEVKGEVRYNDKVTKQEAEKELEVFKTTKQNILDDLKNGKEVIVAISSKSNGIPEKGKKENGEFKKYNLDKIVTPASTEIAIVVDNSVIIGGTEVKGSRGAIIVKDKSTQETIIADRFLLNNKQKEVALSIIEKLANFDIKDKGEIKDSNGLTINLNDELDKLIFWTKDNLLDKSKPRSIHNSINKNPKTQIYWSDKNKISLYNPSTNNVEQYNVLINDKLNPEFVDVFKSIKWRNHVSSNELTKMGKFFIPTGVNESGVLIRESYPSYKDYLLSNVLFTENPPVTNKEVSVYKDGITVKEEKKVANLKSQYLIVDYSNRLINDSNKPITSQGVPTEGKKPNKFAGIKRGQVSTNSDISNSNYKLIDNKNRRIKPTNHNKAKEWINTIFTGEEVQVVQGLIDNKAVGKMTSSAIILSDIAADSVIFHEAYHTASLLYLTEEKRKAVYDSWRKENNSNLSDKEVEENLADEFMLFMDNRFTPKDNIIKRFFKGLKRIINFLLKVKDNTPEYKQMFDAIASGQFKTKKRVNTVVNDNYYALPNKDELYTNTLLNSVNYYFIQNFIKRYDISKYTKLNSDQINELYEDVLGNIAYLYDEQLQVLENDNSTEEQKNQANQAITYYEEIFDLFKDPSDTNNIFQLHAKLLNETGMRLVEEEDFINDENKVRDSGSNYIANKSLTVSSKETAAQEVKLLISAIGSGIHDNNGKFNPDKNYLGLEYSLDFNTTINSMLNKLAGSISEEMMGNRLLELTTHIPGLMMVYNKFHFNNPENLSFDERLVKNKFFNTFNKQSNEFRLLLMDPRTKQVVSTIDATLNTMKGNALDKWRYKAYNSSVYTRDNGILKYSKEFVDSIEEPTNNKERFDFLEKLGISYDNYKNTIEDAKNNDIDINKFNTTVSKIANSIKNGKTEDIFNNEYSDSEGYLNTLTEIQAKTTLNSIENRHKSLSEEWQYDISQHNLISTLISELNNAGTRDELLSRNGFFADEYCKNSMILKTNGIFFDKNGKKRDNKQAKISMEIIEGMTLLGKEHSFDELAEVDKLLTYITNIVGNERIGPKIPMLRPSDNKIYRAYNMDFLSSYDTISDVLDIIPGYIADEINKAKFVNTRGLKYKGDKNVSNGIMLDIISTYGTPELKERITQIINDDTINGEDVLNYIKSMRNEYKGSIGIDGMITSYLQKEVDNLVKYADDLNLVEELELRIGNKIDNNRIKDNVILLSGKEVTVESLDYLMNQVVVRNFIGSIEQTKLFLGHPGYSNTMDNYFKRLTGPIGTKDFPNTSPGLNKWMSDNFVREFDGKSLNADTPTLRTIVFNDLKLVSNYVTEYEKILTPSEVDDYKKLNIADGQGYISLDGFRELLYRMGDWNDELEALYNWEVEYYNGDNAKRSELLKSKPKGVFNPQKLQNYGFLAGKEQVPQFYKFSVFPLVPSVVNGMEIEKLMNYMIDNKVDIATHNSGIKIGPNVKPDGKGYSIYNKDNNIEIPNDIAINETLMAHWGKQLNIAHKIKDKVTQGTQMNILLLSTFKENDSKYRPMSYVLNGRNYEASEENTKDLHELYINLNAEKILIKQQLLNNKLGLTIDNGTYKFTNKPAFKSLLEELFIKEGYPDAMINNIDNLVENGIDFTVGSSDIESMLYSMLDSELIHTKRNGTMAVQVSVSGLYKDFKDDDLKFYTNENGVITKAEVYLPSFYKSKLSIEELKNLDPNNRLIEILGFRIPTSGLNSIESLTIKGFLPEEAGNIVILPKEIVAKAGSDFDIDKLNIYYPNYYYDKKGLPRFIEGTYEEYINNSDGKYSKDEYNALKIENELLEVQSAILASPENFKELITPIGSSMIKEQANKISKLKGESSDKLTWKDIPSLTVATQKAQEMMGAKKGVGITAKQITSHVNFMLSDLGINSTINTKINNKLQEADINIILPHIKDDLGNIKLGNAKTLADESITEIFNQFVNAYVDAAKDPFIYKMNAGPDSINVFAFLIRAGVPLTTVTYFMNQPIILDYIKEVQFNNSVSHKININRSNQYSKNNEKIVEELKRKYAAKYNPITTELEDDTLRIMIQNRNKLNTGQKQLQCAILDNYLNYTYAANEIRNLVTTSSYDTTKTGSTSEFLYNLYTTQGLINNQNFVNIDKYFGKESYLYGYKQAHDSIKDLFKHTIKFLDDSNYNTIIRLFTNMYNHASVNKGKDSKINILNILTTNLKTYLIQKNYKDSKEGLFNGDMSIPKRIAELKDRNIISNVLLDNLIPLVDNKGIDNLKILNKNIDNRTKNAYINSWIELSEYDYKLAEDLAIFSIFQNGITESFNNFSSYIPPVIFNTLTDNILFEYSDIEKFLTYFYQNNSNIDNLIPSGKTEALPFYYRWTIDENVKKEQEEKGGKIGKAFFKTISNNEEWIFGKINGEFSNKGVKNMGINRTMYEYTENSIIPENTTSNLSLNFNELNNYEEEIQESEITYNDYLSKVTDNPLSKEQWDSLTTEEKKNIIDCK